MSLSKLPQELLGNIVSHLDRPSLKKLRLTAKQFEPAATEALFSTVYFKLQDIALARSAEISIHPRLKHLVKTVSIPLTSVHAFRDCDCDCWFEEARPEFLLATLSTTVALSFPKLQCLQIAAPQLDHECGYDYFDENVVEEEIGIWQKFLRQMISRMSARTKNGQPSFTKLEVSGQPLHYKAESSQISSHAADYFENLKGVQEMVLSNLDWFWETPSTTNHYGLENLWLPAAASSLTRLTIRWDKRWGSFPLFPSKDLVLPVLEYLSLDKFTILYESQVDWLASLTTLKTLELEQCSIPWLLQLKENDITEWDVDTTHWRLLDASPVYANVANHVKPRVYENSLRWESICHRLEEDLPLLKTLSLNGIGHLVPLEQLWWTPVFRLWNKVLREAASSLYIKLSPNPKDAFYDIYEGDDIDPDFDPEDGPMSFDERWTPGFLKDKGLAFSSWGLRSKITEAAFISIGGDEEDLGLFPFSLEDLCNGDLKAIRQLLKTVAARR